MVFDDEGGFCMCVCKCRQLFLRGFGHPCTQSQENGLYIFSSHPSWILAAAISCSAWVSWSSQGREVPGAEERSRQGKVTQEKFLFLCLPSQPFPEALSIQSQWLYNNLLLRKQNKTEGWVWYPNCKSMKSELNIDFPPFSFRKASLE